MFETGLILAGGKARRMKAPKILLPTFSKRSFSTFLTSNIDLLSSLVKDIIILSNPEYSNLIQKNIELSGFKNIRIIKISTHKYTKYGQTLKWYISQFKPKNLIWVMGDHYIDKRLILNQKINNDLTILVDSKPLVALPNSHSKFDTRNIILNNKKWIYGKQIKKWRYLDVGLFFAKKVDFIYDLDGDFDTFEIIKNAIKQNYSVKLLDVKGKYIWYGANTPEEYIQSTRAMIYSLFDKNNFKY